MRAPAPSQGQSAHRDEDAVWHAAAGQPALVALRLLAAGGPHVQPAGLDTPGADHPGVVLCAGPLAGLVSYGLSADLLGELLPLGRALHANTVRRHVQATAQRLEDELGQERWSFIDSSQRDREELPRPALPLVVGLDGGYVHSTQTSRRDGWFEVIVGKAVPSEGRASCFGYVQTYDTKPKRRRFEVLNAQGMQENQQVTFLTDGGEDIRNLPCYLNPQAEHLLDWFHVTMRLTVMTNMAKVFAPHHQTPTCPHRHR